MCGYSVCLVNRDARYWTLLASLDQLMQAGQPPGTNPIHRESKAQDIRELTSLQYLIT